jgi:hypothetical protein
VNLLALGLFCFHNDLAAEYRCQACPRKEFEMLNWVAVIPILHRVDVTSASSAAVGVNFMLFSVSGLEEHDMYLCRKNEDVFRKCTIIYMMQ